MVYVDCRISIEFKQGMKGYIDGNVIYLKCAFDEMYK